MDEREKLACDVGDPAIVRYFYLDMETSGLAERLNGLKLTLTTSQDDVPFNAQVKSYHGAVDQDGDLWIVKPVASDEEMFFHRTSELAYLLDHRTGTFAAPTTAVMIGGKRYRATKVVQRAVQVSSYNYLDAPFIDILRADLVNRWIFFDEDRNPNNYLVINNSKSRQFLVAIDYDKADLLSDSLKISGTPDRFGWLRTEKTRFLTLLRPENFEGVSIDAFEPRLVAFCSIAPKEVEGLALSCFTGFCADPAVRARAVAGIFLKRRDYVNSYFRSMFKSGEETKKACHDEDYAAFGQSFMDMYNKNR